MTRMMRSVLVDMICVRAIPMPPVRLCRRGVGRFSERMRRCAWAGASPDAVCSQGLCVNTDSGQTVLALVGEGPHQGA